MHDFAGQAFTDEEWADLEAQRITYLAQLVEEKGQDWVDENAALLEAQWEYVVSLGL